MIWLIRIALLGLAAFIIWGLRWMLGGLRIRDRNRRLATVMIIWSLGFALVWVLGYQEIADDVAAFLLAGLNLIIGLPCLLAVVLIYIQMHKYRKH